MGTFRPPTLRAIAATLVVWAQFFVWSPKATAFQLSYSGRLARSSGEPAIGPVNITFRFYGAVTGGQPLATIPVSNVPLEDGIFQVPITLTPQEIADIFGDGSRSVYIEVESQGSVYPRQAFSYVPLALRVPIDPARFRYDDDGRLTTTETNSGGSALVSSVAGRTGAVTLATDDLTEGTKKFYSDSRARNALSAVSPIAYNSTTGQISLGAVAADLSMASFKITSLGTPVNAGDAVTKSYADGKLGGFTLDQSAKAPDSVIKWDSSLGKFYFGADQVGTTGSGIALLNGLGTSSQSLAASMQAYGSDTAPTWHSASSSHTLNFPLASTAGVTGGLISKSDFDTFSSKQSAISSTTVLNAGTVTSALQNGYELKPYASSAGGTGELRFDELAANGPNFVGFKAPDILSGDVIWTLPNVMGTSGQVLSTGSSGVLSWITLPSAPVATVAGRTGAVTLSNTDISGLGSLAIVNAVSGGTGGTITDDSITNADINSSAAIVDTKLATIATSGKVANSATTATSAGTANAIVARDASGNFTAGTITATLNGNATNVTGTVALANGGTGATTAASARTNLGAAASGANGDITSLTGLTTPLTVAQGGTGASTVQPFFVLAGPGVGPTAGAPSFRALTAGDLPTLDAAKITSGTFANSLVNWATPHAIGATTPNSGSFTSLTTNAQIGHELRPYGTTAGSTSEIRFTELAANGTNYVGFKAPDTLAGDVIWTLPSVMGTSGQVLSAGASGVLSWTTPPSAPVTTVAGRTGAVTISNTDISGLGSLATVNVVSGGTGGTITDDSITNADINSSAAIVDTKLATIATAGKVANSATTATSAGTANAIVARDASGNFTAGTITATLNGNATNVTGTVAPTNGGTGLSSTPANGQLMIGSSGTYVLSTLTAGSGISISSGAGAISVAAINNGTVTNVTASSPLSVSTGSTTPALSISQASAFAAGFLSAGDWATFNSKQSPGNYLTALTGDGTASGPSGGGSASLTLANSGVVAGTYPKVTVDVKGRVTTGASTISNADIDGAAAIDVTKLAGAGSGNKGKVLAVDDSGAITWQRSRDRSCDTGNVNDVMVPVGTWCVDKYESSICSNADGTGTCFFTDSTTGADTDANYPTGAANVPSSFSRDGGGTSSVFAVSKPDVIPARGMTWYQASVACAMSGKQLIPDAIWQLAATGTVDPGASGGTGGTTGGSTADGAGAKCNTNSHNATWTSWLKTGNGVRPTNRAGATNSSSNACLSRFGVADMVGNLWEWTDRNGEQAGTNTVAFSQGLLQTPTGVNGVSDGTWNLNGSAYGYGGSSYGWQNGSPSAAIRGGSWNNSTNAGVFALTLDHSGSSSTWRLGFRCARPR